MADASSPSGSLTPAIEQLAKKLAEDPRSKVFIPLAEEYMKAGFFQEAAAVLEDGLKNYPTFVTALVALGRVYLHLDQADKAKAVLEEVIRHSPENLMAHRMLAKLHLQAGRFDAATCSCEIVLAANAKDEEGRAIKAKIAAKMGQSPDPSSGSKSAPNAFRLKDDHVEPVVEPAGGVQASPQTESDRVARLRGLLKTIRERRES